jgi:ribosomal protein L37AE/L43A
MGEKCGKCGSLAVNRVTDGDTGDPLFECSNCQARWAPGSQMPTHGICDNCLDGLIAKHKAA